MSLDLLRSKTLDANFNKIASTSANISFLGLINPSATAKVSGNETLVAGTVSVATTASDVKAFISLMRTSDPLAANVGTLAIRNRTNTGFDIVSSDALDVGTVSWLLFNGG